MLVGSLGLIACLAWVLVPVAAKGQQAESTTAAVGDLSAAEASVTNALPEAPDTNKEDRVTNRSAESTDTKPEAIENSDTARPSLDYEPTETISEDSSVSFPVDL